MEENKSSSCQLLIFSFFLPVLPPYFCKPWDFVRLLTLLSKEGDVEKTPQQLLCGDTYGHSMAGICYQRISSLKASSRQTVQKARIQNGEIIEAKPGWLLRQVEVPRMGQGLSFPLGVCRNNPGR